MKKLVLILLFSLLGASAFSLHIKGGFFTYEYLGPGVISPTALRYKITLTVYMDCSASGGQINNPVNFTIFSGTSSSVVATPSVAISSQFNLSKTQDDPCISGNQAGCFYKIVIYELSNIELASSPNGYTVSYQRCCRIDVMDNIVNPGSVGNTYTIKIPGTSSPVPNAVLNSSPSFPINDTVVICERKFFRYPVTATDKDGDSLSYSFCSAYTGASQTAPAPDFSDAPPYSLVPYVAPYNGSAPLGALVSINPLTGLISGTAPPIINNGEYVITVCVSEFRNGVFLAETRKELHIRVRDCDPLVARLNPVPTTCDGFTVSFSNAGTTVSGTQYFWDFGDPGSGALNTSTAAIATHTYSDTGIYQLKLIVSNGGLCADSATIPVKVYPGFFPGFKAIAPLCKGIPIQFADTSRTNYGVLTGWHWNFGNPATNTDTSILQNPTYTYPSAGTYNVTFVVANTFGCIDTITIPVVILENPVISVSPRDTIYCALDTIQLTATGTGIFSWLPATNIINANTATPLVHPSVTTTYIAALNQNGCISKDSVIVRPKNDLVNAIAASATSICAEDTITLTGSSNYTTNVTWSWTPVATVESPSSKITRVFPLVNTTYTLVTRWGKNCVATTTQPIVVKPLAIAEAGPGGAICAGQQTIQLTAGGGDNYQWIPATGLSNAAIPNPVASPGTTTTYTVLVGVSGCSKTKKDSVTVIVRPLPPISLVDDTLICSIDTIQLTATGTGNWQWSPNYQISSVSVSNPFFSPVVPTLYNVSLTDAFGCKSIDSVFIDVKLFVTVNAGNDTTICRGDGMFINTTSDALHYLWTPSTFLNSDTAKRPFANPLVQSITYHVLANIGKCQSTDEVTIRTVPYPKPNAGMDTTVCFGTSAFLHATGGNAYLWSPATFLSAVNIPNPISVNPTNDILYIVTVTDIQGCPKPVSDSVIVHVEPQVVADAGPSDTTIVIDQPLILNGTGGGSYLWSPSNSLSDPTSSSPTALPQNNVTYILLVTKNGCTDYDSIKVKLYLLPPSLYVPTAFSPNGDGYNDVFKPILLGMKALNYFKIFNRWGELVFSTTEKGKGWDGTYKGMPQDSGTFVWMTEGVTYKNEKITKKGYVVLVR